MKSKELQRCLKEVSELQNPVVQQVIILIIITIFQSSITIIFHISLYIII